MFEQRPTLEEKSALRQLESGQWIDPEMLRHLVAKRLSADQAEAFAQVLENPPAPTEKLKLLMKSKAPWE